MKRYKVLYCFINLDLQTTDGHYHVDFLDNNGEGFTHDEAVDVVREIGCRDGVKWASMRPIGGEEKPEEEEDWSNYSPCVHDHHEDEEYTPTAAAGDYSPSHPWDAPGMSISDFI